MFETILRQLTIWRNETAKREGVDGFRVLPNRVLEEIARLAPNTKAEMIAIKGIKEAKFAKYGAQILRIVGEDVGEKTRKHSADMNYFRQMSHERRQESATDAKEATLSVSEYLDKLNANLAAASGRIRGEVSSLDIREKVVYFSIKDKSDESLINCLVFRYQYETLGVKMEEGREVVVVGYAEIYKPNGRLSLRVSAIELEGEGALKKEYEELKKKLEGEGVFAESAKRKFVALPQNVGLITSREGAAIGDFTSNIGQFGLSIKFVNSSVEGRRAVFELIGAIRTFQKSDIDTLVIIRGGGSLESLQAFNNEALIREAKKMKVPVICGVGHDRDISLLSLSVDYSVSTPTAAARLIGALWEREIDKIDHFENNIMGTFQAQMEGFGRGFRSAAQGIEMGFQEILRSTEDRYENFLRKVLGAVEDGLATQARTLGDYGKKMGYGFAAALARTENQIARSESTIKLNDPFRQLRLGYGIISKNGSSVRSVEEMDAGDLIKIRVWDGEAQSEIKKIKRIKK